MNESVSSLQQALNRSKRNSPNKHHHQQQQQHRRQNQGYLNHDSSSFNNRRPNNGPYRSRNNGTVHKSWAEMESDEEDAYQNQQAIRQEPQTKNTRENKSPNRSGRAARKNRNNKRREGRNKSPTHVTPKQKPNYHFTIDNAPPATSEPSNSIGSSSNNNNRNSIKNKGDEEGGHHQELERLKRELATTKKRLRESEKESETQSKVITSLNAKLAALESGNAFKKELETTKKTLESTQKELSGKILELEKSERKSNARKEHLASTTNKWIMGKKELETLKQQMELEKKKNELSIAGTLQTKKNGVTNKKEDQNEIGADGDLQVKYDATLKKLEHLQLELATEKEKTEALEAKVAAEQVAQRWATREIQELKNELRRAEVLLQPSKDALAKSQKQVARLNREIERCRERLKVLEEETNVPREATQVLIDGSDAAKDAEENEGRLRTELDFLSSVYGDEEVKIAEDSKVKRFLHLRIDQIMESIPVELTLTIPNGYPKVGTLAVEANVPQDSRGSAKARACVVESLPKLLEICRLEAQACEGYEALLNVLTSADDWVKTDWASVQEQLENI